MGKMLFSVLASCPSVFSSSFPRFCKHTSAPASLMRLACMLQIEQAIAALSLKMGQGKKGGKPMKV